MSDDTGTYTEAVMALEQIKAEKKALEEKEAELTKQVEAGWELGMVTEDVLDAFGLKRRTRDNGYDDSMVALCKKKGLDDAWAVKEVLVQAEAKEAVASGQITEDEAEAYKKKPSVWYELPRGKKG